MLKLNNEKGKAVAIKRETSYTTAFVYKQAISKEDIFAQRFTD